MNKNESLFKTKTVPGKPGSGNMFEEEFVYEDGPVTCLGKDFKNDQARREYFTELLGQKLKDPDFRKIEGFPIGEDEDILALSDPPYYTACPNPWVSDFIAEWEAQKPAKPEEYQYHREPFAADVSEGKNDPIYNAHSYHTKVPHKAIMRYILHYTEPGDIVFDGFCGTGMTGVAAQMCGDRDVVQSLGYQVKTDGTILQEETDENGKKAWRPFSKLGIRKSVLNDLSPAATFIAYNYNTPVDIATFEKEAKRILAEVEKECGWMYETKHSDGRTGKINHILWSDVFICPECTNNVVFWDVAVDKGAGKILNEFPCPACGTILTKRNMERAWVSKYDRAIAQTIRQIKQIPVVINYNVNGKRFEKLPDEMDIALIKKNNEADIPYWFPVTEVPLGDKTGEPLRIGLSHIHHFYTQSALYEMSSIWEHFNRLGYRISRACLLSHTAASTYASKLRRYRADKKGGGPLAGTLYIASLITPPNPVLTVGRNVNFILKGLRSICPKRESSLVSTQSSNFLSLDSNSLDYIFTDPPFGSNLNYSELNLLWESWLKVLTNNEKEAIENKTQGKGSVEYRKIMTACFMEAYRILKPGRWMTVEFSNTKALVWNNIQTALTEAGFIIANVSALDKKQGSFNAVTNPTSVKQDLIISAYKPNGGFEERFKQEAQTEEGVWDFIRTHLKYLPVIKKQGLDIVAIPERDPRILYDQVIAYYVRKGYPVPISSQEFQLGLDQRFGPIVDGMYFLREQRAEYDRKKMIGGGRPLQQSLFVYDEASAIGWLRNLLRDKPQSFQDINPQFMKEISGWRKNEVGLELSTLLEQNFLLYDEKGDVPDQIHSYLSTNWKDMRNLPKDDPALMAKAKDRWYVPDPNKEGDLIKLREKALLKEFEEYKQTKKKLKIFRLEAVRTGFKKAWQEKDYVVIVAVAEKIPNNVLEEDPKLLMWYNLAVTRTEDSGGGL